jgi:hypothetical protein
VAHVDQEEVQVPPPYKGTWRIVAQLGRALSGAIQGPSLGGRDVQLKDTLPKRKGEGLQEKTQEGEVKEVQSPAPESSGISAWHASPAMEDSCPALGTCMESTCKKPTAVGKKKTSLHVPGT